MLSTLIRKKYKSYKNLNYNRITTMRMIMMMIMIRIINERKLRIIIRVNIIITTIVKTMRMARMIMRMARMIMRMIKATRVTGVNIMITIKLRIIRIARVTTIIMRMRISAMTIEK